MWRFCTLITTWSHFSMFSWRLHDFVENGTKTHTKLWNKTTDFCQCQLIFIFKIRCLKARKPWLKVAEKKTNQTFFVPQSVIFIEPWFRVEDTLIENHPKCLIWIFHFWHFPLIFVLEKPSVSSELCRSSFACMNLPNITIIWLKNLCVIVIRSALNFHDLWLCTLASS